MAKQRGPVASTFTGRVGNVVGAKMKGGEYVTRSYQPSVKNPNTLRQRVSRLRMATASQIAAILSPALQSGYAQASASTKMYPRNMFVKDMVVYDGMGVMTWDGTQLVMDYESMLLSKKIGINAVPTISALSATDPGFVTMSVANQTFTDNLPEGQMGVVIVAYCPHMREAVIHQMVAPTAAPASVNLTVNPNWSGEDVYVYAFYKWIPETQNGVPTTTEPWKYPSETGATVCAGHVTAG